MTTELSSQYLFSSKSSFILFQNFVWKYKHLIKKYLPFRDSRGHDRMVVVFVTTYAIRISSSAVDRGFEPRSDKTKKR